MFTIKDNTKYEGSFIINGRVHIGFDCSGSMNCGRVGDSRWARFNFSDLIDELHCLIVKIEYEDAFAMGSTWKMPRFVVLEKDGYQLEFEKIKDGVTKWKQRKLKHNKKSKNAANLHFGNPIMYNVRTGEKEI
jgi:hypothetical protein